MQRSEKEQVVQELHEKFAKAKAAVLAEFRKLPVDAVTKLRRKLREGGVEYRVLKNTLAKRAAEGTSIEKISDQFRGPVAVALSYADVVAPAKILSEFTKDTEALQLKGGIVEGQKLDVQGIQALAKMPGLTELRAQLIGLLKTPAQQIASILQEPPSQLARVFNARSEQK